MADEAAPPDDVQIRTSMDYVLRTTQQNLVQLSLMADQKANIVLGASFIMLTIIVGISSSSGLTASLATLGAFTTASAILALFAVMPTKGNAPNAHRNPFFFGDIASLEPDEYAERLREALESDDSLLTAISRDIHESASLLHGKKYTYLRWSYSIFVLGLLATALAVFIEWSTGAI